MITVEDLKSCHMKAVLFADGAKGSALQVHRCVEHPRLTQTWVRESRTDKGTITLAVDDIAVPDLQAAVDLLNAAPASADGDDERRIVESKRMFEGM